MPNRHRSDRYSIIRKISSSRSLTTAGEGSTPDPKQWRYIRRSHIIKRAYNFYSVGTHLVKTMIPDHNNKISQRVLKDLGPFGAHTVLNMFYYLTIVVSTRNRWRASDNERLRSYESGLWKAKPTSTTFYRIRNEYVVSRTFAQR